MFEFGYKKSVEKKITALAKHTSSCSHDIDFNIKNVNT